MNDFLNARELQEWIGISKPTLLSWLNREEDPLPGVKIGGRWKFRREAILSWWERQEAKNNGSAAAARSKPATTKQTKAASPPSELDSWIRMASRVLGEGKDVSKDN